MTKEDEYMLVGVNENKYDEIVVESKNQFDCLEYHFDYQIVQLDNQNRRKIKRKYRLFQKGKMKKNVWDSYLTFSKTIKKLHICV